MFSTKIAFTLSYSWISEKYLVTGMFLPPQLWPNSCWRFEEGLQICVQDRQLSCMTWRHQFAVGLSAGARASHKHRRRMSLSLGSSLFEFAFGVLGLSVFTLYTSGCCCLSKRRVVPNTKAGEMQSAAKALAVTTHNCELTSGAMHAHAVMRPANLRSI